MKKNHVRACFLTAVIALVVPAVLLAQQQPRFEAVLSGRMIFGCFILPFITDVLEWVNPDRVEEGTPVEMVASAVGQPVFALRSGQIVTLQPDGTHTTFAPAPSSPFSLTVATTGRVFVASDGPILTVFSPAGVQEASYPLPGLLFQDSALAVAWDGCTIYYGKPNSIGRINGCTGAVLSDFTTLPPFTPLNDIYPLRTGEVLLALADDVVLHDASGNFIRTVVDISTYGFSTEHFAMQVATTADEQVLYIAIGDGCFEDAFLLRALIRDDARELSRRPIQMNSINGLVIGTASTMDAPTASETALMILAIALALGGVFLLRR